MMNQLYRLTDQQHATVLAALRYYQIGHQGDPKMREAAIDALATNMGDDIALDSDGVDELYEHLQEGPTILILEPKSQLQQTIQEWCMRENGVVDTTEDESKCQQCGASTDDGEGWDGLCGNCADKA